MKAAILDQGAPASCYPLTLTRPLAACPVANEPLLRWQTAELQAAGCEVIEAPADKADLHLRGDAWIESADLCRLVSGNAQALSIDGEIIAWLGERPQQASDAVSCDGLILRYAWDLLALNERLVPRTTRSHYAGHVDERVCVDGVLVAGHGTRVLPGVYVEGVVLIGRECKIGPNCYLRGPTAIGDGCHIGQAVEIKSSIIMDKVAIGHLSYVGDSIIGVGTNFGAGTMTANFRHDGRTHRSMVAGELVDTGRRKFGAIIGDDVHTGIHTSIYPGRKLWPHTSTRPGDVVQHDLVG